MALWVLGLVLVIAPKTAPAQMVRSPVHLKGLSLDELLETRFISLTGTLETWQDAPTAISVLTAAEIERAGAVRLAEVLRLAPGLSVSRYHGSSYSITARGFGTASVNKMQVLMDGRSLYTPLFAGVFWEVQDTVLPDLERIEVVRGPGATLWGGNAMNGVINIVSKDARDTQGTLLTFGGGLEEQGFATVRHGGRAGARGWYRAYLKHVARDEQSFVDGASAGDDMAQTQVGLRYDAEGRNDDHVTVQGDAYWNTFGTLGRPDANNQGWNILGRWSRRQSDDSEWITQVYFDHAQRDVPQQFSETRNTFDLSTQWQVQPVPEHALVVGLGLRDSLDDTGSEDDRTFVFSPSRRRLRLFSGYVQDEITIVPGRWTAYVGTKFEHNDYTGFEAQPGLRVAFTPDVDQTWWAAVSRAVRAPTRVDTHSRFRPAPATGFVLIQGNPDYQSESCWTGEIGYRVQPNHAWFVDVATFYSVYDNLRSLEPTLPSGLPLVLDNLREAETWGVELVCTLQPAQRWRLRANLNYLHEELRLQAGSLDTIGATLEASDPAWTGSIRSTLDLNHGLQVDGVLRGASARPGDALSGYVSADVRLAWRFSSDGEIALIGQNLLSPRHAEFPAAGAQPEVERAWFARATFNF